MDIDEIPMTTLYLLLFTGIIIGFNLPIHFLPSGSLVLIFTLALTWLAVAFSTLGSLKILFNFARYSLSDRNESLSEFIQPKIYKLGSENWLKFAEFTVICGMGYGILLKSQVGLERNLPNLISLLIVGAVLSAIMLLIDSLFSKPAREDVRKMIHTST